MECQTNVPCSTPLASRVYDLRPAHLAAEAVDGLGNVAEESQPREMVLVAEVQTQVQQQVFRGKRKKSDTRYRGRVRPIPETGSIYSEWSGWGGDGPVKLNDKVTHEDCRKVRLSPAVRLDVL